MRTKACNKNERSNVIIRAFKRYDTELGTAKNLFGALISDIFQI